MIRGRTLLIFKSGVKGQCHTLHFVVKPYKHNTDWTVSAGTVKLSTHTTFDKRKTPIDFQVRGHRSRSHATLCCLNLVYRIVKLGTDTTYDKMMTPIAFKVKGQCHMLFIVVKPCTCSHDTDWTVSARTIKLGTHTSYDKRMTPIDIEGHGSNVKVIFPS